MGTKEQSLCGMIFGYRYWYDTQGHYKNGNNTHSNRWDNFLFYMRFENKQIWEMKKWTQWNIIKNLKPFSIYLPFVSVILPQKVNPRAKKIIVNF